MAIYKGDDTNAFGNILLSIDLVNSSNFEISKAVFQCGTITKVFNNPTFPLLIS